MNAGFVRAPGWGRMRYEKQASSSSSSGGGAATRRAQFTSTSQDQSSERKFHALSGRVIVGDGLGYSRAETIGWVQMVYNCEAGRASKEWGVRWRKWRCGCNMCTSFLCLKMADRPLGPEQQVPCQWSWSLCPNKNSLVHLHVFMSIAVSCSYLWLKAHGKAVFFIDVKS